MKVGLAGPTADVDAAAVIGDDAVGDGEPQARPALLRRVKCVEDGRIRAREPRSVVLHVDENVARPAPPTQTHVAATGGARGVYGVVQEVEQHLRQLRGVGRKLDVRAGSIAGESHSGALGGG